MKNINRILIIFALSGIFSFSVFANDDDDDIKVRERYPEFQKDDGMSLFGIYWRNAKPNEYVYLVPAHFGATVFILIGNVVGTPVKIIYNVCTLNFKGDDYLPPVRFSSRYIAPIGGYIFGGPFWALEKVFYEVPASLFSGEKEGKYKFADEE